MGTAPSCVAVNNPDGTQTFLPSGPTESQKRKGGAPRPEEAAVPVEIKSQPKKQEPKKSGLFGKKSTKGRK